MRCQSELESRAPLSKSPIELNSLRLIVADYTHFTNDVKKFCSCMVTAVSVRAVLPACCKSLQVKFRKRDSYVVFEALFRKVATMRV